MKIFMAGADVGGLEEAYVVDALRHGWYENKYYYVEALEKQFADYHNRNYALMTTNCTHALHLILEALGVGSGDQVIVPECTWIASVIGAKKLGSEIIFCDIEENSWCLSPESVENNINRKTKAIIAVDLFGNMCNWTKLNDISEKYNIPIIEDAAEALGSSVNGIKAGKFGLTSTFSFHNTKTMTTGEGGMLLLDDEKLYNKCVKIRDLGRGPNTKPYFNEIIGEKFMPFNVQAALGLAQFQRLDELLATKRKHFEFYKSELSHLDVQFNFEPEGTVNGAWITAMVVDEKYKINKEDLIRKLADLKVPSRPFFYPLSSIPALDKPINSNVVAYSVSNRGINLPGAANLTEKQLHFICDGVKRILQ